MNVLMVTSSYPRHPGDPVAPSVDRVARGIAARGHSVDVVLPYHPLLQRRTDDAVRFFDYDYAPTEALSLWGYGQEAPVWLFPLAALALRRELDARILARRYDVVHAHSLYPDGVLAEGVVSAHGIGFVLTVHEDDRAVRPHASWWKAGLWRGALDHAQIVITDGDDLRGRLLRLGAAAARTHTLPDGIDVHVFSPDRPHEGARERLGVTASSFLVLASGRLDEASGFEPLLEAAAKTGGIEVAVVGDGPQRAALEAKAKELGVRARFPGGQDGELLATAYAAADVIVVPARGARPGRRTLEALASGRPVVAVDHPEIRKLVEPERNGLLVPADDPAALIAALRRLVRESETATRLAQQARRDAVDRWSWEAVARRTEELYTQAAVRAAA
jgi:glycosyltransferase involved in cell wall biosynthesis